jgi:hypothetical protein
VTAAARDAAGMELEPRAPLLAAAGIALLGLIVYGVFAVTMILWG